jgi:hypothetical protein
MGFHDTADNKNPVTTGATFVVGEIISGCRKLHSFKRELQKLMKMHCRKYQLLYVKHL